jgi:cardiolipin synthase (CMP-forming)
LRANAFLRRCRIPAPFAAFGFAARDMPMAFSMLKQVPNALTVARLALAPVVAYAIWRAFADAGWGPIALGLFVVAALTDLFDGMAARALDAHSRFGRVIDPIADKALVGLPLIAISAMLLLQGAGHAWIAALASAVIVCRDLSITLMRMSSADGEGVRVSKLAKWKTSAEMMAVAAALLAIALPGLALPVAPWMTVAWVSLLALAAALSAITGLQYLGAMRRSASA